ncbi:MAG TPA: DUF1778 domain-containing protein [Desulfonatronum sp.]|jgi:uncharacterized protein (DUF1778 family)|nr:DUF1778 domain-containing protein [Desulfonatronum sp.]
MPQPSIENNHRMSLRIAPAEKALLMRAVAIQGTTLTGFVTRSSLEAARTVVQQTEQVALSEKDSLRVFEALENPPKPNAKLLQAAQALPKPS